MKFSLIERQKFKQYVERILHVPGNYSGGILEMALVLDMRLDEGKIKETSAEIARTLKQHSEVFRNVRLNLVEWKPGERLTSRVTSLPVMMMGSFLESHEVQNGDVYADDLFAYLKLFQARSKLILIVTAGGIQIREEGECMASLKPFLGRKLIWMMDGEEPYMESFLQKQRCNYLKLSL